FSHPRASYFLLRGQKKVTKEKAARLPLASCAPRFRRGLPKGTPVPLATRFIHETPLRAVLAENCGARRGKRERVPIVTSVYDLNLLAKGD
ncbi:hypothetical protein V2P20_10865, partial [Methylobacter sp. Wu1]|uniref:hypothetical protein n=1 Tax=Methylobacter sp. Wu1 TaxID=3119359 RepID=UPI002F93060C